MRRGLGHRRVQREDHVTPRETREDGAQNGSDAATRVKEGQGLKRQGRFLPKQAQRGPGPAAP